MRHIIDPASITDEDAEKMIRFFEDPSNARVRVWRKNTTYSFYEGTEFQFTHDVVRRERATNENEVRYEFISNKRIGKGGCGSIYEVAGTLALTEGHIRFKKAGAHKGKTRVVKIQSHEAAALSTREYDLSKEAGHLAVKKPTIQASTSYSVMRKLPGSDLQKILEADRNYQNHLTIEQRIGLTQAITRAMKAQCTDRGIIHRDIKPENILVDLSTQPITVNIIDYGLSTQVNNCDQRRCGTVELVAPEVWAGSTQTPKVDVFSLGRVIALLWYCPLGNFGNNSYEFQRFAAEPPNLVGLFRGINDVSEEDKRIIQTLLRKMLVPGVAFRFSIENAIEITKQLNLNFRVDFSAVKGEVAINNHRENLLDILHNKERYHHPELIEAKRQEIQQCFEQAEAQRKQEEEECAKLKNILQDYEQYLEGKLVEEGLYIRSSQDGSIILSSDLLPAQYSSRQKKLLTRYAAIHGVHEAIKSNAVLSDHNKGKVKEAVAICRSHKPDWFEKRILHKIIDLFSLGLIPLFRLFSKDIERARQKDIEAEINKSAPPFMQIP